MRERQGGKSITLHAYGITPARAGKTLLLLTGKFPAWDHPRSCGKDRLESGISFDVEGSPPLVRERQEYGVLDVEANGITPARAGKTAIAAV